ncbi:DUF423 domain-containing protein [Chiayiivirga flava]|uniref:Uncharacterized membrane protein YgdD (TMEM256/DUF423 family) n=1 Tax=Chiayiivirga flava TaxID=659595 RepID=A0A7W8G183_9GAMM|nr:DUF423 domain-containing protein [Chiayiivirga flava]MBB5207395.1 uncharacterized membrane protein YgdD (TMEM256/DUF423 family) [Chiayiivirga flava]
MPTTTITQRIAAAFGALGCAVAVALAAYAAHAPLQTVAKGRLEVAVFQLALHALALCIFAPRQRRRFEIAPIFAWVVGTLLFCGSLVGAALWNTSTTLAPVGGVLLMLGWVLQAIASLRR